MKHIGSLSITSTNRHLLADLEEVTGGLWVWEFGVLEAPALVAVGGDFLVGGEMLKRDPRSLTAPVLTTVGRGLTVGRGSGLVAPVLTTVKKNLWVYGNGVITAPSLKAVGGGKPFNIFEAQPPPGSVYGLLTDFVLTTGEREKERRVFYENERDFQTAYALFKLIRSSTR